jgi:CRISPR/Cas system-associated exonuclease Cas4 (RecB family)
MPPLTVLLATTLIVMAVFLFIWGRTQGGPTGLPDGDLIYNDNGTGACPVLVSHRYGLKGKPDALVRTKSGDLIPVEQKKTRAPRRRPYDGDLIQATAYCILVEEKFGRTPPLMRIQYADHWFDEPYTPELKLWVLRTCAKLRQARHAADCPRSHRVAAKCRNCGQRQNCREAL